MGRPNKRRQGTAGLIHAIPIYMPAMGLGRGQNGVQEHSFSESKLELRNRVSLSWLPAGRRKRRGVR